MMMASCLLLRVTTAETATASTAAATTATDLQPQMKETKQIKQIVTTLLDNTSSLPVRSQRTHLRRRMPGFDYDLESAEAGFVAGLLCVVLLLLLLCCCCCGGGRGGGCSLWDIVALACLWEICCDRDGAAADSFMMM
jgi:hypothetical protein